MAATFSDFVALLNQHRKKIWLGQSVDTSVIHTAHAEYCTLPILTSVGCAMRRPTANEPKFDRNLRAHVGAFKSLMVDSGGFVLMNKVDCHWTVSDVAKLYRRIDADHLVALDVPPNRKDRRNRRQAKYLQTLRNLELLLGEFGDKIVPVAHGRGRDELEANCRQIVKLAPNPKLIALGGMVPLLQQCGQTRNPSKDAPQAIVAEAIRCMRSYFPKTKIHLFGAGSLHTVLGVLAMGANSVDSIGWRKAAGFGSVYLPGRHRRLLTHRERERPCRPFVSRKELEILRACGCPACSAAPRSNIATLTKSFQPRALHNIWVLYSEIAGFLEAKRNDQDADYLSARLSDAWLAAIT